MKWYRVERTITYRRDIQASTQAEADEEMACDYGEEDIESEEQESEEITKETQR